MPVIHIETFIAAPADVCFDLARSVEAHTASTARTRERVVGGIVAGLLELGDEVTWEARHLGFVQRLTARITRLDRPRSFEDQMVRGAFASFTHVHEFHEAQGGTNMIDRFDYRAPLGPLGTIADWLFFERYMRTFLVERAAYLKHAAEAHRETCSPPTAE